MPRIKGMQNIIDYYNPKSRKAHAPLFHYGYLLRTARNLAAAFRALHARGYVIGDVHQSDVLVADSALVTIVGADSFQVRDPASGLVYPGIVGKSEFTPPELQGRTLSELTSPELTLSG